MHFLMLGLVIGLASGLSPGPLQTLVLSQAAQFGALAGITTAMAPLITDAVIVALTVGIVGLVSHLILHLISLAGALLVGYLSLDAWKSARPKAVDILSPAIAVGGVDATPSTTLTSGSSLPPHRASLWRAALVNILNPHPWLFWAIVGAPLTIRANSINIWYAVFFIVCFYIPASACQHMGNRGVFIRLIDRILTQRI